MLCSDTHWCFQFPVSTALFNPNSSCKVNNKRKRKIDMNESKVGPNIRLIGKIGWMPTTEATAIHFMDVHKGRKQWRTVSVKVSSVAKNNQKQRTTETTAGTGGIVRVICGGPSPTTAILFSPPPCHVPSPAGCPKVPPCINTLENNVIQFHSLRKWLFQLCTKRTGISSIFMSILTE